MSDFSRMGVHVRPDIHKRFARILSRVPAEVFVVKAAPPARPRFKTKLSPERVQALRELRADGITLDVLARRFHIAISTASRAANGSTWR